MNVPGARARQKHDQSPGSQRFSTRTAEDHLESLYLQQSRLTGILQAPKVDMPAFDGDPMSYFPFIRAFEENVEKLLHDEGSKPARLMQLSEPGTMLAPSSAAACCPQPRGIKRHNSY